VKLLGTIPVQRSRFCAAVQMDTHLAHPSVGLYKSLKNFGNGFEKETLLLHLKFTELQLLGIIFFSCSMFSSIFCPYTKN